MSGREETDPLWQRACNGDVQALGEYLRANYQEFWAIARCMLQDRHEAEDAFQSAAAKVVKTINRYEFANESDFQAFLNIVQRRVCYDALRKRGRRPVTGPLTEEPPSADEPLSESEKQELHDALDKLPPKEREPIIKRYFDDMPIIDIAAEYQIQPPAMSMRIIRTLAKLRDRLS